MGISGGPDIVQDGLVLSLDASDMNSYVSGSGNTWYDLSGNGNNGSATTIQYVSGLGMYFPNITTSTIFAGSSFSFTNGGTIECWVYSNPGGGTIGFRDANYLYGMNVYSSGSMQVEVTSFLPSKTGNQFSATTTSPNTTWNYYTHTISGTTNNFYFNGILASTQTGVVSTPFTLATSAVIGRNLGGTINPLNTYMQAGRVYNRALSAAEVLQNYNAQKSRFNL